MEQVLQLEEQFGKFAGFTKDQTVACSSGTAALHLSLESLKLPIGSEVILCDFNMVACARAVVLAGLKPRFVDCDKNLLINPNEIWRNLPGDPKYNNRISAILCTHIYGRYCDMQAIHDIAGKYDLKVIEDLAEAHGLPPHPNTDAACWSFYRNKIIHGEEGGAVAFKDEEHAKTARCLRSLGFGPDQDYTHEPRGHNYRLANLLATPILQSIKDYKAAVQFRCMVEEAYNKYCPDEWRMPERQAPWVYDIRIPELSSTAQNAIVKALKLEGIEARHAFKCMSGQEEFRQKGDIADLVEKRRGERESEKASHEVIYLPLCGSGLYRDDELEMIAKRAFDIIKSTLASC